MAKIWSVPPAFFYCRLLIYCGFFIGSFSAAGSIVVLVLGLLAEATIAFGCQCGESGGLTVVRRRHNVHGKSVGTKGAGPVSVWNHQRIRDTSKDLSGNRERRERSEACFSSRGHFAPCDMPIALGEKE